MRSRSNFDCRFFIVPIGALFFVGNIVAQKVGDPMGHLPMKKYQDLTAALVTSGTITALDRPGLRVFMKCDKPFWGPLREGSDSVVLWPTVVQLAVWVKAAPVTINGKKANFTDFAVGQKVAVQYIMEPVITSWVDSLECFARHVDIVSAPEKNKK